jgi:hypothetical protein
MGFIIQEEKANRTRISAPMQYSLLNIRQGIEYEENHTLRTRQCDSVVGIYCGYQKAASG